MADSFYASFATEEAFVHATFREFVKLCGNGSQAHFQLQCLGGHAWVQLMSALGHQSSPHLLRKDYHNYGYHGPRHHGYHGSHGPNNDDHVPTRRRRKGAKQRDRDRARATLHRAQRAFLLEAAAAQ